MEGLAATMVVAPHYGGQGGCHGGPGSNHGCCTTLWWPGWLPWRAWQQPWLLHHTMVARVVAMAGLAATMVVAPHYGGQGGCHGGPGSNHGCCTTLWWPGWL